MRIENYIHGKDGNEKALCESLEYHGEWMGDEFVTVTVHSPEPVDFQIGDYLEYRNENFSILDDPNVIKKARSGSYQEGFTYENIKLYPESARMKHIAFNDYVLPDPDAPANKIPYSSLNIFSFFAASVEDLADRLQANLDRMEHGRWAVFTPNHDRTLQRVPSEISKWNNYYDGSYDVQGKTDVNVTVSGLSCWEALKLSYTSFDVSYYIVGRKKRFLKIFGNRVNLDETERLIKSAYKDIDCACAGLDDHMCIYITSSGNVDEIRDFVAEKTHLNFSAFEVRPIDTIPKNASGKTLYSELSS